MSKAQLTHLKPCQRRDTDAVDPASESTVERAHVRKPPTSERIPDGTCDPAAGSGRLVVLELRGILWVLLIVLARL